MKVVILAGGLGTRLSEETQLRPKPMVEVGGEPILWHIMNIYATQGLQDFIVCLGYKGYVIKEYFANYFLHRADVTIDLANNSMEFHHVRSDPWRVTLVDTGADTMTGGRLKRVRSYLSENEDFAFTYGDGVADINIAALLAFHRAQGRRCTLTAVRPPGRYGATRIEADRVIEFMEKPQGDGGYINGGFFIAKPEVLDLVENDAMPWEGAPLNTLAATGQLSAFVHEGFWQPMDTLRDKAHLETLWANGQAPWKIW